MIRALLYLRLTSFRNWVLWRVRRLRRPRYLVGAVVGVAYLYFFFFRHALQGPRGRMPAGAMATTFPQQWLPAALAIGGLVLLVVLACAWIVPRARAALGFSEAEIAFLFPAPITRRRLVHYRLLTAQVRTLGASLVMALLSSRWSMAGHAAWPRLVGWWLFFSVMNLHFTGAGFVVTRWTDRGVNVLLRRLVVLGALVAIIVISLARIPDGFRLPADPAGLRDWLTAIGHTAPLSWLLLPLQWVLAPFFAGNPLAFLLALGPALGVIVAHYFWVVQAAVSFEDASIAQAEKRAARVAAWRSGERRLGTTEAVARPAPFELGSVGRPEIAFFWKNLLSTWPYFNLRVFGAAVILIGTASFIVRLQPGLAVFAQTAAWIALGGGAYLLIVGPQFARQDIRGDMRKLDVLKTYPLTGWQIVLGELLAPTAILVGITWLALLVALWNIDARMTIGWLTPGVRVSLGLTAAIAIVPVTVLQLLVPNTAALLFPSWVEVQHRGAAGPEVMGQRMIYFFAQMLTMVLVLLPAAGVGAGLLWLFQFVMPLAVAIAAAAIPVLLVLVAEVCLGVWWLGRRFEAIDVAEELRE
ncbi:putative ABC exporter domain-containing protein [Opitutus sp. ER46]|uniref:putative ABC exporter domain-containing protein n=1 Tax=Opitutus sp. ER46 TaxID=2161864 RepID=UPI000D2FCA38|nr:putative ABC exporter domain-containing protein [Opitutus sp. ER46]PTX98447.1 hypothetical protein DB354_04045 [Opitutus sp. ER46]